MGALAVTTVVRALHDRWGEGRSIRRAIPVHIDNKGVVDRLNEGTPRRGIRRHTDSDIDLHMEILQSTAKVAAFDWQWIKGHQDEESEDMTLEAILNVEADEQAAKGHRSEAMVDDFLPRQQVVVTMEKKTISNTNMEQGIIDQRHGGALRAYIIKKEDWDESVYEMVDWDLYRMYAGKKSIQALTNTVKLIHGWQNVGKQKEQINEKSRESACLLCSKLEHQHHYLKCADTKWDTSRRSCWDTLKKHLQVLHTSEDIIAIIGNVIASRFDPVDLEAHGDTMLHKHLKSAIQDQARIGWENMVKGRLAKSWTKAQAEYLTFSTSITRSDPKAEMKALNRWRKHIVGALLRFSLDMWEARNTILHGGSPDEQRQVRRKKAIETMKCLYKDGAKQVPPAQRRLFSMEREKRGAMSTNAIEAWIGMVEAAKECMQDSERGQQTLEDLWVSDNYWLITCVKPKVTKLKAHNP